MSAIKKSPALLVTTCAHAKMNDDGDVEVTETHTHVDPVIVEHTDDDAGEVVYDAGSADGKSTVGYSRVYAASWEDVFGDPSDDVSLPI
jgi:hypothetical protein